MVGCLTVAQKFCCLGCIIWFICISVVYRFEFSRSARSAIVILFVGGFPMMVFLISFARSKYRDRSRNADPQSSMISPEQREQPHTSDLAYNSSIDYFLLKYVFRNNGKAEGEGNDCVVCLGQLQHGETVVKIESCSHVFHEECIDRWLQLHKTCPICRSRVGRDIAEETDAVRHIQAVV